MLNIQSNEVKTNLSSVLRQVESGQEFLITKHKKVIAKLIPYVESGEQSNAQQAVLAMKKIKSLQLTQQEVSDYRHTGQR